MFSIVQIINAKKSCLTVFKKVGRTFFTIASVSESSLKLIQTVQNRAIRCIYRLKWDSPSSELSQISGLIPIKSRLIHLDVRCIVKVIKFNNPST